MLEVYDMCMPSMEDLLRYLDWKHSRDKFSNPLENLLPTHVILNIKGGENRGIRWLKEHDIIDGYFHIFGES